MANRLEMFSGFSTVTALMGTSERADGKADRRRFCSALGYATVTRITELCVRTTKGKALAPVILLLWVRLNTDETDLYPQRNCRRMLHSRPSLELGLRPLVTMVCDRDHCIVFANSAQRGSLAKLQFGFA